MHYLNWTNIPIGSAIYNRRILGKGAKLLEIPYFDLANWKEINAIDFFKASNNMLPNDILGKHTSIKEYLEEKLKPFTKS